ncbi:MarR family transcriptional regulator [Leptospira ognonensis]|uniref:MarR family transcriptional regulator n=1 Tax=Leptospira ognonensis TaxID=2484945 RepID=A0A4R9JZ53_9LEPT|nr:MarR family transcriptional regulator [Leptospira ognonensis]TGL57511.1 MarR family transcriptional regulator [Leptospira ognonensis]
MSNRKRFNSLKYFGRLSEFLVEVIETELTKSGFESLSATHFEILTYLIRKKVPVNMTRIAEAIHRKKPTVTILVNKLETLNLIQKESSLEDKREFMISLTKKGKSFRKVALKISSKVFSLKLWGVEAEESELLFQILEKIYHHTRIKT